MMMSRSIYDVRIIDEQPSLVTCLGATDGLAKYVVEFGDDEFVGPQVRVIETIYYDSNVGIRPSVHNGTFVSLKVSR
jgi:hypothetical protein